MPAPIRFEANLFKRLCTNHTEIMVLLEMFCFWGANIWWLAIKNGTHRELNDS